MADDDNVSKLFPDDDGFLPSDGPNRIPIEDIADHVVGDVSAGSGVSYHDALRRLDLLTMDDLRQLVLTLGYLAASERARPTD